MQTNLELIPLVEQCNFITKSQQHLLIILRLKGKIEGSECKTTFKNTRFFGSIEKLIQAGWVKKNYVSSDHNRPKTFYVITKRGAEFNSQMMQHPEYKAIWDRMKKGIIVGG